MIINVVFFIDLLESFQRELVKENQTQLLHYVEQELKKIRKSETITVDHAASCLRLILDYCVTTKPPEIPLIVQFMKYSPITAGGLVGLAAMTSANLNDALDVAIKYTKLVFPFITITTSETETQRTMQLEFSLVLDKMLSTILIEGIFHNIVYELPKFINVQDEAQMNRQRLDAIVLLKHPYSGDLGAIWGVPVLFGQSANKFVVSKDVLHTPLKTYSPSSHQVMLNTLERQLLSEQLTTSISSKVSKIILDHIRHYKMALSAEEVALRLAISTRSLYRELSKEQQSFRSLVERVRMDYAESLISAEQYSMAQIADKLGFSSLAAFSKAFKRSKGFAPTKIKV